MSHQRYYFLGARLLVLAPLLWSRLASAEAPSGAEAEPSKAECARAFEESQRLRNAARYLEANREVRICSNPRCGAALSEECEKIYGELEAATPSVVFAARDGAGRELPGATVRIDDDSNPLAIDGKPVPLDPGNHTFAFTADGFEPRTEAALIRAGERFRSIVVVFDPPPTPADAVPRTPAPAPGPRARVPVGVYVMGGVAAVGVAGFVGFRLWGASDFDDLSRTCKPDCASFSVDAVRQKYLISTVSLAVGAAAAVGAVTWYFAAAPATSKSSAHLQVAPSADGVTARFATTF